MESILSIQAEEPVEMTYFGIGSCPHTTETLDSKQDQLIPQCLHEFIRLRKMPMRIVHMDPFFDRYKPFLETYFQTWNVIPVELANGYRWMNDTLDIIVIPDRIDHKENYWFFESLVDTILTTRGKLLLQEYTGYELKELHQQLYESCAQQEKYKRRILLDMTYGTEIGCSTDMMNAEPFYDSRGDFLNLQFMTDEDTKRCVGTCTKLDALFRKKYRAAYLSSLNSIHVDYRRKLKGESLMYGSSDYSEMSSPDEIMTVLQRRIQSSFEILLLVHGADGQGKQTLKKLCEDYKSYDPYKWYDAVNKLVLRP